MVYLENERHFGLFRILFGLFNIMTSVNNLPYWHPFSLNLTVLGLLDGWEHFYRLKAFTKGAEHQFPLTEAYRRA